MPVCKRGQNYDAAIPICMKQRSISYRITEPEYQRALRTAEQRGQTPGEFARDALRNELDRIEVARSLEEILLGEVLAMRSIVGNVIYNMAKGVAISPETMNRFIAEADASKSKRAQELLKKLRERPLLQSTRGES